MVSIPTCGAKLRLLSLLAALAGSLSAQTTFATLTGTAIDPAGAVVPGVRVTATKQDTRVTTSSVTNDAGVYTIPGLVEGPYTVRAEHSGFKAFVAERVELFARDNRRLDLRLEVGDVVQQVEVTAGATLIETETARLADTRTSREMRQLPMNEDNIRRFMVLTPGVTPSTGTGTASFYGSRRDQTYFSTDGTNNDGDYFQFKNLDAIQELRIDAGNVTAEFGPLGNTTIISKSGSNTLHGSGFWYYTTPGFRARNPFALDRPSGINHNLGVSLSGPIYIPKVYDGRNRTFFFTSFEEPRQSRQTAALRPSVPIQRWRNGDFSNEGLVIRNPLTGAIYSDGRIPASQINPVAKKIQERFYPLPNVGNPDVFSNRNYFERVFYPYLGEKFWTSRVDQKIGSQDSVFARYTMGNSNNNPWEGGLPAFGPQNNFIRSKSATVAETHIFGPSLVNEVRFGYQYQNSPRNGPLNGPEVVRYLGITGLAPNLPDVGGLFKVGFSGVGIQGLNQADYRIPGYNREIFQFQDHLSYYRGRHTLKAGFDTWRLSYRQAMAGVGLFGNVTFANTYSSVPGVGKSGHPYADFLFGVPTTAQRDYPPAITTWESRIFDFFLQDDWKVTTRLTLNLGARYEWHPYQRSAEGTLALFDVVSGSIVVPDAGLKRVSPLVPRNYVSVVGSSSLGMDPKSLVATDRNNVAPRVGFAYSLNSASTLVLRGGFGFYYDSKAADLSDADSAPFSISEPAYTNTQPVPTVVLPLAYPTTTTAGGPATITLPEATNPHLRIPLSYQWNLTLERQVRDMGLRMSYIGTAGRQLVYRRNYNSPVVDDRLFLDKPRPFPKYPAITYADNGGNHTYHGLSMAANRKMKNGLFYQAGYTWARDMGDSINAANNIENPFDRARERAPFSTIPAHRITAMAIYELPFGKGRKLMTSAPRVLDLLLGGWQLSTVWAAQTGIYLTPNVRIPDPTGTAYTTGRNRPLIAIRPDHLRNANLDNPNVERWFDVSAFAAPPTGRFGNSANGVIIGPGQNALHGGIHKYLTFSENPRVPKIRIEMTASNALNHPNWSNPAVALSDAGTAGTISGAGGPVQLRVNFNDAAGPRVMQFAMRVEW